MRTGASRAFAALGLALTVATCRDALGPRSTALGRVAVAPVFPSEAVLGEFGLAIDAVRFIVVRPAADTIADTTLALPPDATELELDLRVPLIAAAETLSVSVVALSGTVPLFLGTRLVPVPSRLPPTVIPLDAYIGPAADSIVIQPRDPFILVDDSLRFQVQGFNGGVPVTQFYVAWSTGDTSVAGINGFGVLRAPASRGSVTVRARTPSGASDSVTATFTLPATQLVRLAGDAQADTVGDTLVTPLEVQARAADGIGVGGAAVRFRSLSGGAPGDTTVTSDGAGRARVTGVLGPVAGVQSFEAMLPAFPGVAAATFNVTAAAGAAERLAFLQQPTNVFAGNVIAPAVQIAIQDGFGNTVTAASDSVTLSKTPLTGNADGLLLGTVTKLAVGGIATFSDLHIDIADLAPYRVDVVSGVLRPATSADFFIAGQVAQIIVGSSPIGAGLNGVADSLYIANSDSSTLGQASSLGVVDVAKQGQVGTVPLPAGSMPFGVGVNRKTKKIYVSNLGSATLSVVDGAGRTAKASSTVGAEQGFVAVDEATNRIYVPAAVTPTGFRVVPIDGTVDTVLTSHTVPLRARGRGIALNPADGLLYVVMTNDSVMVIDPIKKLVVDSIAVGSGAYGIAIDAPAKRIYVSNETAGTVSVIDAGTHVVLGAIPVGQGPQGLALDPSRGRLFVANAGAGTLSVIDTVKGAVIATLSVGLRPREPVFRSADGRIYVTNFGANTVSAVTQP